MSRLQNFPVDALKIDRAFVCNMSRDVETCEILRIIVMLAYNLGLEVVAEGAETEKQVNQLKQRDCELAQGNTSSSDLASQSQTHSSWVENLPGVLIPEQAWQHGRSVPVPAK